MVNVSEGPKFHENTVPVTPELTDTLSRGRVKMNAIVIWDLKLG
jgi:hypothetical protein